MNDPLIGPWRAEWDYEDDCDAYRVFEATGRVLIMCEQRVIADIHIDQTCRAHQDAIIRLILAAPDLLAVCESEHNPPERMRAVVAKARQG